MILVLQHTHHTTDRWKRAKKKTKKKAKARKPSSCCNPSSWQPKHNLCYAAPCIWIYNLIQVIQPHLLEYLYVIELTDLMLWYGLNSDRFNVMCPQFFFVLHVRIMIKHPISGLRGVLLPPPRGFCINRRLSICLSVCVLPTLLRK